MSNDNPDSRLRFESDRAYKILGLEPDASQEEVKQAYRKLVKIWHPDRFVLLKEKQEAEEKIKKINEAYDRLKFIEPSPVNQSTPRNTTPKKPAKVYPNRYGAETFYNLGVENAVAGRYEKAIADFSSSIRLNPNYIEAYTYRGFVCSQLGYENRASADLSKAAQLQWQLKNPGVKPISPPPNWWSTPKPKSKLRRFIERFLMKVKKLLGIKRRYFRR